MDASNDLDMLEDICDYGAAMQAIADGEELIPAEVVYAVLDGENPIRVWREYRGLSQTQLAESAGISPAYLSQLETGKREGTTDVLGRSAATPNLTIDDLIA